MSVLESLIELSQQLPDEEASFLDGGFVRWREAPEDGGYTLAPDLLRDCLTHARRQVGGRRLVEASLKRLGTTGPATWRAARSRLLAWREEALDAELLYTTSWIGALIVEVDGRRLEVECQLVRAAT